MKIRVGDTFNRKWIIYNPLASNRTLPDKNSPVNLTGVNIVFVVSQGSVVKSYPSGGTTVQITPLTGEINVELSPVQTQVFRAGGIEGTSYLDFTYPDGDVKSKYQETVRFVKKGDR